MIRRVSLSVVVAAASVFALAACGSESESTAPASVEGGSATTGGAAAGGAKTGEATPTEVAASVIGKAEAEATATIDEAGYTWRVLRRDGQDFPATMDYVDTRIGLTITSGKVTAARVG